MAPPVVQRVALSVLAQDEVTSASSRRCRSALGLCVQQLKGTLPAFEANIVCVLAFNLQPTADCVVSPTCRWTAGMSPRPPDSRDRRRVGGGVVARGARDGRDGARSVGRGTRSSTSSAGGRGSGGVVARRLVVGGGGGGGGRAQGADAHEEYTPTSATPLPGGGSGGRRSPRFTCRARSKTPTSISASGSSTRKSERRRRDGGVVVKRAAGRGAASIAAVPLEAEAPGRTLHPRLPRRRAVGATPRAADEEARGGGGERRPAAPAADGGETALRPGRGRGRRARRRRRAAADHVSLCSCRRRRRRSAGHDGGGARRGARWLGAARGRRRGDAFGVLPQAKGRAHRLARATRRRRRW